MRNNDSGSMVSMFKAYRENMRRRLTESDAGPSEEEGYVPYTQDDEMLQTIMKTAKAQFGADFTDYPHPLQYNTRDGNVMFNCSIGGLNNAKVQFILNTPSGQGCRIWTDSLCLTESNLDTLRVIYGVYMNWCKELSGYTDRKPMTLKNQEASRPSNESVSVRRVRPGDDWD